ncbi:MAG: DUF3048 domain-containing protein [bacterium]|nr:DUF3048 domain-containing protein [bacterium]
MRRGTLVAVTALLLVVAGCREVPPPPVTGEDAPVSFPAVEAAPSPPQFVCPLDGEFAAEAEVSRRILAVIMDNHPSARPQAGLAQACLVYEVLVEGGITRLVAFYLHGEAPVLLPIRSARPYFLDWVAELDAVLAHCGGTPDAMTDLARLKIPGLDEVQRAQAYYERHTGRKAPYNLRSSTARLRQAIAAFGYQYDPPRVPGGLFRFDANPAWEGEPAAVVRLAYGASSRPSVAEWRYDEATGYYLRFQNGLAHTSATDSREQVKAGTVIVLPVRTTPVKDSPEGYLSLQLVGNGKATVFARGMAVEARWSKKDRASPTIYTLAAGSELVLPPGPVWIQVVPLDMVVEVQR